MDGATSLNNSVSKVDPNLSYAQNNNLNQSAAANLTKNTTVGSALPNNPQQ